MNEKTKQALVIALAVVAVIGAVVIGVTSGAVGEPKEKVVGTLPMPEGGGRNSEASAGKAPAAPPAGQEAIADEASGMPADMR